MNEKRLKIILEAMQGITYSEWKKLSHTIERSFSLEANNQSNGIKIASPDKISKLYNVLF